jgi:hypothetical protein
VFAFSYKSGNLEPIRIWHSGAGENDYIAVTIVDRDLVFEKVVSGVAARCTYTEDWRDGQRYKVGWRCSRETGMELVVNGKQVAVDSSPLARRDAPIGDNLFIGSDGRRFFSTCPISNMTIYSEA